MVDRGTRRISETSAAVSRRFAVVGVASIVTFPKSRHGPGHPPPTSRTQIEVDVDARRLEREFGTVAHPVHGGARPLVAIVQAD